MQHLPRRLDSRDEDLRDLTRPSRPRAWPMVGEGIEEQTTLLLAAGTDDTNDHRFRDRSPGRASHGIDPGDPRKEPHVLLARHMREASRHLSRNPQSFRVHILKELGQIMTDCPTVPHK